MIRISKMKFGGMKFKINFKETPRKHQKTRVNGKGIILIMTTFEFIKSVIITITSLKVQHCQISLKHTSTLDLLTSVAPTCSYGTQWRCSTEKNNEEIPPRGTTYWALTICSWNFNSATYLETQPNLHNSQELDT